MPQAAPAPKAEVKPAPPEPALAPEDEDTASLMARIQAVFGKPKEDVDEPEVSTSSKKAQPEKKAEEQAVPEAISVEPEPAAPKTGLYTPPAMSDEVKESLPKAPAEPKPEVYDTSAKEKVEKPATAEAKKEGDDKKEAVAEKESPKEEKPAASPFAAIAPPPVEPEG